jgi:hypothetical protein
MSTLDDVIADAKFTGEFEGSGEDVRATRITLKSAPEVIASDLSCDAITTFTRLVIDRGISFNSIVQTIIAGYESGRGERGKEEARETRKRERKKGEGEREREITRGIKKTKGRGEGKK